MSERSKIFIPEPQAETSMDNLKQEKKKVSKKSKQGVKLYDTLWVKHFIPLGKSQRQISETTHFSLSKVKRIYRVLIAQGIIRKIGYGTWKITAKIPSFETKEGVKTNPRVSSQTPPLSDAAPTVKTMADMSLHDLIFKVKIPPHLIGWRDRGHYLESLFPDKSESWVLVGGRPAQRVFFQGHAVCFYDSCLILHVSRAFYGVDYVQARLQAESFVKGLLRALWHKLRFQFSLSRTWEVSYTDREHYARINDPVAKDFRRSKRRVRVQLSKGYFVIDFSDHIDHAELQFGGGDFLDRSWKPFLRDWELYHTGMTFSKLLLLDASHRLTVQKLLEVVKRLEDHVFSEGR
jgi:DNA-binding Lrp family transcriptional regulator